MDAAAAVRRHHPPLLLLTMIPPLPPSSIEKLSKLVPRRRWRLATGSTATPVDAPVYAAATVCRHRTPLLLLTMILPLPPTLLLFIENLPKLVPRRCWRLAVGSTATPVDAVAAVHCHRPLLLLLMITPPLPAPLLSSVSLLIN